MFTPARFRHCVLRAAWSFAALLGVAGSDGLQAAQAPQKYALLIGLSSHRFEGIPQLRFAEKDAGDLATALAALDWKVKVLTGYKAEREDILGELYRYAREVEDQDTFLLYFAGHGVRNPVNDQTYWLTYDAWLEFLEGKGIRLSHLMDYVNDIKAGQKIVLLDHCFSGDVDLGSGSHDRSRGSGAAARVIPRGVSRTNFIQAVAPKAKGTVVVAAARGPAFESRNLENGLFTEALLEALTSRKADSHSDGSLSIEELVGFVKGRVQELAEAEGFAEQDVVEKLEGENLVDWVLIPSLPVAEKDEAVTKTSEYRERLNKWQELGLIDFDTRIDCVAMLEAWVRSLDDGPPLAGSDGEVLKECRNHLDSHAAPDGTLGGDLVQRIRSIRNDSIR